MADALRLLAQAADDVPALSALVQSAAVRVDEIAFDRKARRLVLMLSRYRWEAGDKTRVRAALRVECVTAVKRKAWPLGEAVLELLAVTVEDDAVVLAFAAGATLRAEVECPDLAVEDLTEPWPAIREPVHKD
jgi:hypothetical protein